MKSLEPGDQQEAFEEWCARCKQEAPQFYFWYTTLQLELLVLTFIKSLRTGNFTLYVDSLTKLAPWFFILDHTNWVPVHIRDMANLGTSHPQVAVKFNNGDFTVHKTRRVFSAMAIDQAHEQTTVPSRVMVELLGSLNLLKLSDDGWWGGKDDIRI